jgi:hypothetical protein
VQKKVRWAIAWRIFLFYQPGREISNFQCLTNLIQPLTTPSNLVKPNTLSYKGEKNPKNYKEYFDAYDNQHSMDSA